MSVTLGDAILYLSANPDALNADLRKADTKIRGFANGAKKILGAALKAGMIGAGIAIAAGIGILTKSVFEAADAGEAMAKFSATFGTAGDGLVKTLDELATATGRSKFELRESAADFGAVTKALGFTEEGAADMSAAALEMAVDLGAFHNLPTEDVAKRIRKALTGETESMKELGVVVNANRIKQELLNMGYEDNLATVDEAVKAQAIFNIIQRQTTDAVGIAAEEAGSFTGQVVSLKAAWSDFMIDVGTKLLPILTPMLTAFQEMARDALPKVVDWVSNKLVPAIVSVATFISGTLVPALQAFGGWVSENSDIIIAALIGFGTAVLLSLVPAFIAWATAAGAAAIATIAAAAPFLLLAAAIAALVLVWTKDLGGVRTFMTALWNDTLKPFGENVVEKVFKPIGEAIGKVIEWVKEFIDKLKNIKLPDWLTPGSPTPFEKGLRGMAKALEKELTPQLGKFAMQLQGAGAGAGLGTQTTNLDQSRTTRVDQMTINNGRDEQAIMQMMKNWSRD